MSAFVAAIRLLTITPTGTGASSSRALAYSPAFFPVVGTLIGLTGAGVFVATSEVFPVLVAAALATAVPVVLTGALHIDGLADTADGLFGGRTAVRKLEIMADPRVGSYGAVAIGLALILRWAAISALVAETGWPVLVIAAMLSRATVTGVMATFPYARDQGIGQAYSGNRWITVTAAVATAMVVSVVFGGAAALFAGVAAVGIGFVVALYAHHSIGGVTGDIYGAVIEMSEIAALLTLVALIESDIAIGVIW